MKRFSRPVILGAAVLAFGIAGTAMAYAWIVPAKNTDVRIRAAKMPTGVTPSASIQNGQAVVSWSAQEILPGIKMTSYVVTAHDVSATHPAVSHTVTSVGGSTDSSTFTAAELASGRWKWTIIPKFQKWTGDEGKQSSSITFPIAPATVLADAVTAVTAAKTTPVDAPTAATAESAPNPLPSPSTTRTPENAVEEPAVDPTTSAPDRSAEPAKTETPKVDPTPSGSASDPHPSLTAGVS